ncbi:MAG: SDR family NAD(P)-dependent oxidoreductase [Rhodospirillaceae bacterium]|nr:SDR family NAD(P)-dependent oxidoreductase [Rhodospirillaceae bacterium]
MAGLESIYRVDGRVALVTGAARGIGAEIARVLAGLGARVALADRLPLDQWEPDAAALAREARHAALSLDVTRADQCDAAVHDTVRRLGGLDILVNNAGINSRQPAEATDDATLARTLDVNLAGAFRMARAAFPALAKSPHAAIVNLASTGAFIAITNNIPYGVSKAGLAHMTKMLALEWAGRGIRVNAVAPTIIATDMTAAVRADPAYMAAKMKTIPLGKLPATTDVANAVAFLASSAAGMITGQVLAVDGGVLTQ